VFTFAQFALQLTSGYIVVAFTRGISKLTRNELRKELVPKSFMPRSVESQPSPRKWIADEPAAQSGHGIFIVIREWLDALVFAFVLAMFIRTFAVELFKIPSGSMSPTLLGDYVAEGIAVDETAHQRYYLLILERGSDLVQVFRKDETTGRYAYEGKRWRGSLTPSQLSLIERDVHLEEHHICVNKFAYWFAKPNRGDIVVFRVPFKREPTTYIRNGYTFRVQPYNRYQGVYVKRAVAFDGELAEIDSEKRLRINGKPVEQPEFFKYQRYEIPNTVEYSVKVPPGQMLVFGDNTGNSYDSRFWGGLPYQNLRGKAFFRYWPLKKIGFLNKW
jgi:signal peptidase I